MMKKGLLLRCALAAAATHAAAPSHRRLNQRPTPENATGCGRYCAAGANPEAVSAGAYEKAAAEAAASARRVAANMTTDCELALEGGELWARFGGTRRRVRATDPDGAAGAGNALCAAVEHEGDAVGGSVAAN